MTLRSRALAVGALVSLLGLSLHAHADGEHSAGSARGASRRSGADTSREAPEARARGADALVAEARQPEATETTETTDTADTADTTEEEGFTYEVVSGDTLSDLAARFDVTLEALLGWNPGARPHRIRAGQRLRIVNGMRRVVHTVAAGESLSRIAEHYEVRPDEVLRWNPRARRERMPAGRALVIYTRVPESRSLSVGSPDAGQLENARQLPTTHPAFYVRTPTRAFATDETVRWIVEGFEAVHASDPDAPRVEVHDLSFRDGGPINGHHSHESGRDADVAYYQRGCRDVCRFRRIGPSQLDAARQWALFSNWIERGLVEHIFVDHDLAGALYEQARRAGVERAELSRIFQYPRSTEQRYGIIRHHASHSDHFHVRFVCHESDPDCH